MHQVRHRYGTDIAGAVDIEVARQLMGHASIASTCRYYHPEDEKLKAAVNSLSVLKGLYKSCRKSHEI